VKRFFIGVSLCIFMTVSTTFLAPAVSAQTSEDAVSGTALRSLFTLLNSRLDQIASDSQVNLSQVRETIDLLEQRVDSLAALDARISDIESRLTATEELRAELAEAIRQSKDLTTTVTAIKTESSEALNSAEDAKASASSTAWILTAVSTIVSLLVIFIGLFFSSRFMHLYAENQVSKNLLERIEAELKEQRQGGAKPAP
jgi:DNA repair exonuclease SbcCD ATPase subunit